MTSTPSPTTSETVSETFSSEIKLILTNSFKEKIHTRADGNIRVAQFKTSSMIRLDAIKELVAMAARHNLKLHIARSNAGLKIQFAEE